MSIKRLQELLNSDKNPIKINRDLLKILDIEEAVLYSYLVSEYAKKIKKDEYKFFDNEMYILSSVEDITRILNMSSFKQRNVLNKLQTKGLLKVKLGQARTRYIWINDNAESLERILYGYAISDISKEFFKYLEIQADHFKEIKNLNINSKYLLDSVNPWEIRTSFIKHLDLDNNFSELGLGWLAREGQKTKSTDDKIRA